ncbi:hypothetical protein [Paracoccus simplex]|uniref:Tripartite tricarboxylate transporter TctB family protein n=1 Tax=Paracoccus simplex TaxID=2086346 RepID=A0ABV7S1F4_9RHOB
MSNPTTLTAYATAFMASISLFGLVDAGRVTEGAPVASAITQAYLLPVLGIAAATFLAVTVMTLSRGYLTRPHRWNDERTERAVLEVGLAAACYFGVLALLGYVLALMAPGWISGAAPGLARHWPWFLAAPCLGFGILGHRHKPVWLAAAAVFVTLGLFTG